MKHPLTRALGKAVLKSIVVLFLLLFLWNIAVGSPVFEATPTDPPTPTHSNASEVQSMIDWYGCWTDEAPVKGMVPTHAVVSYEGASPTYTGADLGMDIWLHPHRNPGMTLHAFCP